MFDRDSHLIFEAYVTESMFPKNFDRHALGSCMVAAELATKYFLQKGIKDFKVIEGYVELYPDSDPTDWSAHTWIQFNNGRIFDPTKKQWTKWGFNVNKDYYQNITKTYTPTEYLKICEEEPGDISKYLKENINNILYVCANCEQEFGKVQTDKDKSHGICKRHLAETYRKMGMIEKAQEIENRPDSSFNCPDLAKQQIKESNNNPLPNRILLSGWLTPTGQYVKWNGDHLDTIEQFTGKEFDVSPEQEGYSRIQQTHPNYINITCRYDKLSLVKRWLNKTLSEPIWTHIEMIDKDGNFVKDETINESINWKQKLQNLPESGMGYQKVVFTLKDGRKVLASVFNGDQIKTNLKFKIDDIVDVALQKKSGNKLPNWAENLAGSKPDNYTGNQKINYI